MVEGNIFKKLSVLVILGILAVLTVIILWPIASAIITGLILSYIFYPVFGKIKTIVKEKNIAALIVILLVLFLIFLPLWFLLPIMVKQIFDLYLILQKIDMFSFIKSVFPYLTNIEISKEFATSFNTFISDVASKILSSTSSFLLNLPNLALKAAVVFFVFFFGMRDAELLKKYLLSLSPFSKTTEKDIIKKFKDITSSVIYGFIVVGIIQGVLTGIGLFIFRVPNTLVLTLIAILAGIIPIIGAWIVWIPAVIYLIISGRILLGIGLLLYGFIIVSWVDNIIRPYIVAKKTQISSVIILVGMIGGLIVFGILGLIIGPLILSYLLLILDAYRKNKFPSLFSSSAK